MGLSGGTLFSRPTLLEKGFAAIPPVPFSTEIDEKIALLSGGISFFGLQATAGCISIREKPSVEIALYDRHQLLGRFHLRGSSFIS